MSEIIIKDEYIEKILKAIAIAGCLLGLTFIICVMIGLIKGVMLL